jgi:hypothetical protein
MCIATRDLIYIRSYMVDANTLSDATSVLEQTTVPPARLRAFGLFTTQANNYNSFCYLSTND